MFNGLSQQFRCGIFDGLPEKMGIAQRVARILPWEQCRVDMTGRVPSGNERSLEFYDNFMMDKLSDCLVIGRLVA